MAAAYSLDLRQRVIEAYTNGEGSMRQLSRRFKVSLNFVKRLIQRFRGEASLRPKAHAGGVGPSWMSAGKSLSRELLKHAPDLTLREVCERFHAQFQRTVSISAMNETLRKMRITRKKKPSMIRKKERSESNNGWSNIGLK
jgi:transposase